MKIKSRLNFGYLAIAILVLVVGYIGFYTTSRIKNESAIADASKTLFINIMGMRETLHAYLLSEDPAELSNIHEKHNTYAGLAVMWLEALGYGSDSAEFRSKDGYKTWVKYGYEAKGVRVPFHPEVSGIAQDVEGLFIVMDSECCAAMDIHSERLAVKAKFDEKYLKEKEERYAVTDRIHKTGDATLIINLSDMRYYSKEALFQYRDETHIDKWLESIKRLRTKIAEADVLTPEERSVLSTSFDEYYTIAQALPNLVLELSKKESDGLAKLASVDKHIGELNAKIEKLNLSVTTSIHEANARATALFMGVVPFSIVLALAIAFFTSRSISKPLTRFRDSAIEISRGNLNTSIETTSNDEIGELAIAFNDMTEKLQESYASLEDQVRDRTNELVNVNMELKKEIEERKRMEEGLRESEEKYRTILESIEDGYFEVDIRGNFTFFNDSLCKIHGYTKDELMGMNSREYMDEETAKKIYQAFNKVYTTGKPARGFEWEIIRKDGTRRYVQSSVSLMKDAEGQQTGFRGIVQDITERVKSEEEKKKLQAQLLESKKMEAIATLAGGIAHEFNNTLVGITGNIELLQMEPPDEENIDKYAGRMKASALHMAHLTDQLLAYARGGKYQPKTISLTDFVEETLPLIKQTIDPSIRIETDLLHDILNIEADLTQMQMLLSALLINSAEAIESEGRIRIITKNEEIKEEFAKNHPGLKPGHYVSITVEDDGKGMDEETRSRIFDPFFTTKFQGRGLGMAAVYGIVTNHDGWVSVDSELGKGTVVRIYLPTVKVEVKEEEKPKIEPAKGTGTILVIEDEDIVIDVICAMVERLGYRVLLARTGKETVSIAKGFDADIDLAILDILLPDLAAKEVYRDIMEARPNLKVIVCSGYAIDGPPQEILDAGAQDFIQKPFSLATLSEKLKQVLEGK